jgi:integrase
VLVSDLLASTFFVVSTPCQRVTVRWVVASIRERPTSTGSPRYVVTYRHNGKQTSDTFTRKRDAEKARDLINALGPDEALPRIYGKAVLTGEMPTVSEWLDKHIADLTAVTDRTRADYRIVARRHVAPTLGALDVDEVTVADVARWANDLEGAVSAKTIANVRALLSAAFGYAIEQGLRTDNPMRRLRRSRAGEHERPDMVTLTPQEFSHLRSLIAERWRPFVTVLAGTGMRFGEAVALEVGDVDLLAETPIVRVTKALKRIPGGFEVGPPKSRKSRRTISLSDDLVDVLAPLVTRERGDLLFTGGNGVRVSHSNFYNRVWLPAVRQFATETGRRPRIHDLRHSHASWLIARGVHLEVIRDRLGHESITTTSGVYSHLLPDQHRLTAAALGGLLSLETAD